MVVEWHLPSQWLVNPLVLLGANVLQGAVIYLTHKRTQRYRSRLTDTREALQEQIDDVRRSSHPDITPA